MAKNRVCKKVVDVEKRTVSFTDLTVPNGQTFVADVGKLPVTVVNRLVLHGLAQKLGDTYSDGDSPIAGVSEAFKSLMAGEWSQRGEAGPRDTVFLEALAAVHPSTEKLYASGKRDEAIASIRERLDKTHATEARKNSDPKIHGGKPINPDADEDAYEQFCAAYDKNLRADAGVKAKMAEIALRRAQEAAAKTKEAAKGHKPALSF